MNLAGSYFSLPRLADVLDRWLNPWSLTKVVRINDHELQIGWTRRAQRALEQSEYMVVEMQLYFSCVIKKRVLFHATTDTGIIPVNENFAVCFNAVQAAACDPDEFAANHPAKRRFTSAAAQRLHPRSLHIDYRQGRWLGEFYL